MERPLTVCPVLGTSRVRTFSVELAKKRHRTIRSDLLTGRFCYRIPYWISAAYTVMILTPAILVFLVRFTPIADARNLLIRVEMTRCRDVVSSNTCEKYGNWRLQTEPCKVWMDPVAPWGGLIKGIEEDYRCPTKSVRRCAKLRIYARKGTYHIRNAVLDMKSLQALNLPLEGAVWQTKAFFLEPSGDLHYCFEGTFIFRRVRA
ncbi:hypothetical protein FOCC_FOCC006555 [Frankliniella occidentalis]|nr:hypothetical protein FOCC_FOCC006555 [Frankliniella occidentalis]